MAEKIMKNCIWAILAFAFGRFVGSNIQKKITSRTKSEQSH